MMVFHVGELVGVPVSYANGAFENEYMVSLDYDKERISGFVRRENIRVLDPGHGLLTAEVLSVDGTIMLKLFGSFFTTNGEEPFRRDWADQHLQRLDAAA